MAQKKAISDEARREKNKRIKDKGAATRKRHSAMTCKVYELKIVENKLSLVQQEALNSVFREAKWVRNAALAAGRFDASFATELKGRVPVLNPQTGETETRELRWLGSQLQQAVVNHLNANRNTLSTLKDRGFKVGALKFVSEVNSINLQQFGATHKFRNADYSKLSIQKIPGVFRVRGGKQLQQEGIEFADAKLVRKADGYYIHLTTYIPRVAQPETTRTIGVDFGIAQSFTYSDGTHETPIVDEPERLKRLQRKLTRQKKNSNSYRRTQVAIQKEYQRMMNRKEELANQLIHRLTEESTVYYQDENVRSWRRRDSGARGGKKIQHGILGRVKAKLNHKPNTVKLPSWVATTQWCQCGTRTKIDLDTRLHSCSNCGVESNRDQHAAQNMVTLGQRYQTLTSGTEGRAGGMARGEFTRQLYAALDNSPLVSKPEAATSSVSP